MKTKDNSTDIPTCTPTKPNIPPAPKPVDKDILGLIHKQLGYRCSGDTCMNCRFMEMRISNGEFKSHTKMYCGVLLDRLFPVDPSGVCNFHQLKGKR